MQFRFLAWLISSFLTKLFLTWVIPVFFCPFSSSLPVYSKTDWAELLIKDTVDLATEAIAMAAIIREINPGEKSIRRKNAPTESFTNPQSHRIDGVNGS
jgi:hypothetical protein